MALTAAQTRVVTAATSLFARHGVGGTSLQMIADEIGVTKAAVYHQYKSKDEIVLAAAEAELARLRDVVEAASSRDELLAGMVDLAIAGRRRAGAMLNDPVIVESFAKHRAFRAVMRKMQALLVGEDAGPEGRVRVAMLVAAISGAVMHPFVIDLPDATLRDELLRLASSFGHP
ncbi:MAG TPA: helix-turn-helix domain-containing protein [Acidimicrobiales bacterium]|nr:helix-turn-helix domain-containing protein [Acidimicrobiales bacterium]